MANSNELNKHVAELAAQVAKAAGVSPADAEKVLKVLHVDSHITEAAALNGGRVEASKVKLAYRLGHGGIIG